MALVITRSNIGERAGKTFLIEYNNLDEDDLTPGAIEMPDYQDQSVQAVGDFGGGAVTIQVSNDGTNWVTALDPANAAITFSAAGMKKIATPARYLRPLVTSGTSVDLDVFFLIRKGS